MFEATGEQAGNRTCEGMQGLLKEGETPIRQMKKSPVLAIAEMLGQADAAEILQETLDEEQATDERLSEIGEAIMTEMRWRRKLRRNRKKRKSRPNERRRAPR